MNFSHFIASRLAFSNNKTFTRIIVRFAIIAISISLATMIITTCLISGFNAEISTKVFGFWGHIQITDTNVNRSFEQIPISKDAEYLDDIFDIEWLEYQVPVKILGNEVLGKYKEKRTHGGVAHLQPYAMSAGILSTSKEFGAIILKGVDEQFDWDYLPNFIVEGERLTFNDKVSNGVIISSVTAREMQIELGQRVQVAVIGNNKQVKRALKVTGIYNTGLEEYDKRFAFADLRKVQDVLGWEKDEVTGIEVFIEDIRDLDIINEYLYQKIIPPRMYSETISKKFPSIFEWLKLQEINEDVLLILMIIVAMINMITALMILILERTRMIGVLKALGGSNWQVRKIFLYNAGYIIAFGLLIGNILGLTLCWIQYQTHIIPLDEATYYLSYAPILFDWESIIFINIISFIVILLFLIIPTYLITRITPIKTLRFE